MEKEIADQLQWRVMEPEEKLLHLLNMSLDECMEILTIPISVRDQVMLNVKINVIRAVFHSCAKFAQASQRFKADRAALITKMAKEFDDAC
jgi:hypothetical protein